MSTSLKQFLPESACLSPEKERYIDAFVEFFASRRGRIDDNTELPDNLVQSMLALLPETREPRAEIRGSAARPGACRSGPRPLAKAPTRRRSPHRLDCDVEEFSRLRSCIEQSCHPPLMVARLWRWLLLEVRPLTAADLIEAYRRTGTPVTLGRFRHCVLLTDSHVTADALVNSPWNPEREGGDLMNESESAWSLYWTLRMMMLTVLAEEIHSQRPRHGASHFASPIRRADER